MTRRPGPGPRSALAMTALLVAVAAGCGDGGAPVVTIFGPEIDAERQTLEDSFEEFTARTGIVVEVSGTRHFETEIGIRARDGNPPDIAMFPQPGLLREFADQLPALPDEVVALTDENFDPGFTELGVFDDELKAVPIKADLKSLVWYSPPVFAAAGYAVPETFEQFADLVDDMVAAGDPAFCVGIASGNASGWPVTDWIEDYLLRLAGPDLYDRWHRHEIPFDHPEVVEVVEAVVDLWSRDGVIYGGPDAAVATFFADAGLPLLDGECMMHRQGNFYVANWPEGTELGDDGDISAFYLPGSADHPNITLTGGMYAAAFRDDEAVQEVMRFIAGTDFADARAANEIGGFLSPNRNVDTDLYPDELTREFGEILAAADPIRFDASDLMPGPVGSGTFWAAAVAISTGEKDVATAFAEVEAGWPDDETE